MSLDKFFKSRQVPAKEQLPDKKVVAGDNGQVKTPVGDVSPQKPLAFQHFSLTCRKCKYKRKLVKTKLRDSDFDCPKCGGEMATGNATGDGERSGKGGKKKSGHKYL